MTEVMLFHHVQGLTDGVLELADRLRAGRHVVHAPDLFDGERPGSVEEGIAFVRSVDEAVFDERVVTVLAGLPADLVLAGISWGGATAQQLAQTRPGVRGALLYETCLPITGEWAVGPWPDGVAVQVHGMERDPIFGLEGDLDAARELVEVVGPERAELFVYPGEQHLFVDSSLPSYDAEATTLVVERSLTLLDRLR